MDKKYILLGTIVLGLIGLAVVIQTNTQTSEETSVVVEQPVSNTPAATSEPSEGVVPQELQTITATASSNPDFSTLVAALEAADLAQVLDTEGSYTVFAPTNAAFDALEEGTLESLLEPVNKDRLTEILLYHVVDGAVFSDDVVLLNEVETLQGDNLTIDAEETVTLNGSVGVIETDIEATNGVIHVIDTVLIP